MGGKSTDIPAPDPRYYSVLEQQANTADRMVDYVNQNMASNEARLSRQETLNSQVIDQQMRLADAAETRANDAYSFYQSKGRPVVQQALQDSKDWDSQGNIDNARGRAAADVNQAFENSEAQSGRALARMGINASSGRFMALNSQLQAQKAAALAGAQTNAEEQRRTQGVAMRQNASNIAQGLQSNTLSYGGQSGQMGSSAAGVGAAGINSALSTQNAAISGMNAAGSQYGSAASGWGSMYGTQMQGAQIQQSASNSAMGGLGQIAGMAAAAFMADGGTVGKDGGKNEQGQGGQIRGPGSGISDSIPAVNTSNGQPVRIANGEYIVPADVVKKLGTAHFDKLLEKYHTPAAQQRQGNLGKGA
jgi:hypothetical protein